MESLESINGYKYDGSETNQSHLYLLPALLRVLEENCSAGAEIFEIGCGNGSVAQILNSKGYRIKGIDPSVEGIEQAQKAFPHLSLSVGSAYDDLAAKFGTFDAVVSLEVVEHVYSPRKYAATLRSMLKPGGVAIVSTPYHGYLKNLALALTGKMDRHFTALWDHGHIKFWSEATLSTLLTEAGLIDIRYLKVGRGIPALAKSMIAIARAP